jgi:hypothetical protein
MSSVCCTWHNMPAQQASASDPHPPHPQQDPHVRYLPSKSEGGTKQLHTRYAVKVRTLAAALEERHATRLLLMQQVCHGLQSFSLGKPKPSLTQAGMHTITDTQCMHANIHEHP